MGGLEAAEVIAYSHPGRLGPPHSKKHREVGRSDHEHGMRSYFAICQINMIDDVPDPPAHDSGRGRLIKISGGSQPLPNLTIVARFDVLLFAVLTEAHLSSMTASYAFPIFSSKALAVITFAALHGPFMKPGAS